MRKENEQPPILEQCIATIAFLICFQVLCILILRLLGMWKIMKMTTEDWFGLIMIILLLLSITNCYPHYGHCWFLEYLCPEHRHLNCSTFRIFLRKTYIIFIFFFILFKHIGFFFENSLKIISMNIWSIRKLGGGFPKIKIN